MQLLQRKAAIKRKQKPYPYEIRAVFHLGIKEFKRFHGKRPQALPAEEIMLTERSICRRYFSRMTLFTLTLQSSAIFQIQKQCPREGSERHAGLDSTCGLATGCRPDTRKVRPTLTGNLFGQQRGPGPDSTCSFTALRECFLTR